MKISAVVLDMDGLMLDTEPLYKVAWQQACIELGFDLDDAAYAILIGFSGVAGRGGTRLDILGEAPCPLTTATRDAAWRESVMHAANPTWSMKRSASSAFSPWRPPLEALRSE